MIVDQGWYVGDLTPSVTDTLTDSTGAPVNLTGASVRFRMRAVGQTTMKVDQPATIVSAVAGTVRYDWSGSDTDTGDDYLAWWQVTLSAKPDTYGESLIQIREHGDTPPLYIEPEELKQLLQMQGTSYADAAVRRACQAATQVIEDMTDRHFWLDAADTTRTYTPAQLRQLAIEDLAQVPTSVKIDRAGSGSFTEVWTLGTDFILEPQNAPVQRPIRPFESIRCRYLTSRYFPVNLEQSVQVIGRHGWLAIPEEIKTAAVIIASKYLQRVRQAPFGIVAVGGPETGIAQRIAKTDPDVAPILEYFSRKAPWA